MKLKKKGQTGILSFIFAYIITFLAWIYWAHERISFWGEQAIISGGLTGVKAFLMANLNLFVLLGFVIGLILIIYSGSNQ